MAARLGVMSLLERLSLAVKTPGNMSGSAGLGHIESVTAGWQQVSRWRFNRWLAGDILHAEL